MVTEVYDLLDAKRGNVRKHGFKRRMIPMYLRDRGKFHLALPFETADDSRMREMKDWRISRSARKRIIKSAPVE